MKEILVVANRTLGGEKLLDAVRKRASSGERSGANLMNRRCVRR